jgi:formylglycine-generating enzyme required for sulfatase activity
MKKIFGVLIVAIGGIFSLATADIISGTVTDSVSGVALVKARVMEKSQVCTTFTDATGKFTLNVTTGIVQAPLSHRQLFMAWHPEGGFFSWSGNAGEVSIQVRNLQGALVARYSSQSNPNGSRFFVRNLAQGVYIAEVKAERLSSAFKIFTVKTGGVIRHGTGIFNSVGTAAGNAKSAATGYALTIDKNQYASSTLAVTGGQTNLQVKMRPLPAPAGMRHIAAGTFQMGSMTGYTDEQPVHSVTVSAFYIDTTHVTQADFQALMGQNPSAIANSPKRPVDQVSWYDAILYCNERSKRDGLDTVYSYSMVIGTPGMPDNQVSEIDSLTIDLNKNGYHLPTEAQWEYACRAGTTTAYFWGDDSGADSTGKYSWYYGNSQDSTHPVATKASNSWGLYDMSGNVWQWCNDWYIAYTDSAQTDPIGPDFGYYHVLRGGSFLFMYGSWHVNNLRRSAARYGGNPGNWYSISYYCYGFRVAR